jgi:hypothetical protein
VDRSGQDGIQGGRGKSSDKENSRWVKEIVGIERKNGKETRNHQQTDLHRAGAMPPRRIQLVITISPLLAVVSAH